MLAGKVIRCLLGALVLLAGPVAWAQQTGQRVPFASAANPVGSGGRSVAWGGAFIAIADDATAASWNPGGLVQLLRPEASVALSYHTRQEKVEFSYYDTDTDSRPSDAFSINYASVVYPFHLGETNLVASLNYQRLYDYDRDLEFTTTGVEPGGTLFREAKRLEQSGALTTLTPAFCAQLTPAWSLGLAVNIWGLESTGDGWDQQWQFESEMHGPVVPGGSTVDVYSLSEEFEEYQFRGVNLVVGTHYKVQNWTLAAVYKSSFSADVDWSARYETSQSSPQMPSLNGHQTLLYSEDEKLVWPESYGVGVAYRYSDRLSVALDAYTTRWSQYKLKTDDGDLVLLSGTDFSGNRSDVVRDTWQVRAGAEYLWILPKYVLALRGGAFYDPEPLGESVNEFYGLALGGGLVYDHFAVDAAFQYRFADNIESEKIRGVSSETDARDYFGIVSLIYHF